MDSDDYTMTPSGKLLVLDYGDDDHAGQYYEIDAIVRTAVLEKLQHVPGIAHTSQGDAQFPNLYQLFGVEHHGGWRIECYGEALLGSPSQEDASVHKQMKEAKTSGIVDTDMFCTDFSHFDYYIRTFSARVLEHFINKLMDKDGLSPQEVKQVLLTILPEKVTP